MMAKSLWLIIIALLFGGSWYFFHLSGAEMRSLQQQIVALEDEGDPNEALPKLRAKVSGIEAQRIFSGILLAFVSAAGLGIVIVLFILPLLAQKMTHAVYDSGEIVERDVMHDARVRVAQGDWQGAIAAFREAAAKDPLNRLPWVEIAKIQREQLGDSAAAIATLREAIEQHEWQENDAAYLMFRLAELYDEDANDRASAVVIFEQIIESFPATRHSANARHKLHEWGLA